MNKTIISDIEIVWELERGTCSFQSLPVIMMWSDTTLARLMAGVQAMVGADRFGLALQSEGRKSVEADWEVIASFPDFAEGFKSIANVAKVAGWGKWELIALDWDKKECCFRISGGWESHYQKALGVSWGSSMLAGKLAGYCSKLFGLHCWADQHHFESRGDPYDEFAVHPSHRRLETEIEKLLATDQATRADMAVALENLRKEITVRQRAEEAQRRSEEKFRAILDTTSEWIWEIDREGRHTYSNPAIQKILGYAPEEILCKDSLDLIAPGDREMVKEKVCRHMANREGWSGWVVCWKHKGGGIRYLESNAMPILSCEGELMGFRGSDRDITERKIAEEALQYSENRYRNLIENSDDWIWEVDASGFYTYSSPQVKRLLGYSPDEVLGKTPLDLMSVEEAKRLREPVLSFFEKQERITGLENLNRHKDGHPVVLETSGVPVFKADGTFVGYQGIDRDITHRKRVEEDLRESEQKFKAIIEHNTSLFYSRASDHQLTYVSPQARHFFDCEPEEALGHWQEFVSDNPLNRTGLEFTQKAIDTGMPQPPYQLELKTRKGRTLWVEVRESPVVKEGQTMTVVGVLNDITERRQAEQEKTRLEAQLLQAQKMELVGRLAGGVAHDFNNMLSVILGYTELMKSRLPPGDPLQEDVTEIQKAGDHSREIVRQLLAFSRKQMIVPRPLQLNALIDEMQKTLARLIGEHIELRFNPGPDLWPIKFDPAQIDQILVNLAVNARDAMPYGGFLSIETSNVILDETFSREHYGGSAGPFVLLQVGDTGAGMDKEVLSHLFEPFFTTKEVGRGTGLGLATIYGIVKQNGGFISAYSELGQGSVFKIYLPRIIAESEPLKKPEEVSVPLGGRTILLVEDDEMVRGMTAKMLRVIGCQVIAYGNPQEALANCERGQVSVDLLISDVVMPGMNGSELCDRIMKVCPTIKVLFMSGYGSDIVHHHGVLSEGVHFLQKPFSKRELIRAIRQAIGES